MLGLKDKIAKPELFPFDHKIIFHIHTVVLTNKS